MSWSKEDWIKILLQMILIYQMAVGVNIYLMHSQERMFLAVTLVFMPLVVLLFFLRKLVRDFFVNVCATLAVGTLYGILVYMVVGDVKYIVVTVGVILFYSVFVSFTRTSLNDAEYTSEIFVAVPVIFYSYAVWRKLAALRTISCLIFTIFIVLQIIYNYMSRIHEIVSDENVVADANRKQEMEQYLPREQILGVTKTLAGLVCIGTLVVFMIFEIFAGNIFLPVRDEIKKFMTPPHIEETIEEETTTEEDKKEEENIAIGELEQVTSAFPDIEEKETDSNENFRRLYGAIFIIATVCFGVVCIVVLRWLKQMRERYTLGRDEFTPIEEGEISTMGKIEKIGHDNVKNHEWSKRRNYEQRQVLMEINKQIRAIKDNIAKVIVGKENVVDDILVAMLSEGHILLEDVPGTGKTMLAKTFAKSIGAEFARIQFTADLLPTDVTGLNYYNQKMGEFTFKKGPIFSNLILADEINRATPKTQSALIECMEEHQVTVDGKTSALNPPFLVIATENPIENAGTFPLPEAQLDRFLLKVSMGYPNESEELKMIDRFFSDSPLDELGQVCSKDVVLSMIHEAREVAVSEEIRKLIVQIIEATREHYDIEIGASPRASLAMMRAIRSYAYIHGRRECVVEDVKDMAVSVLAHRIRLKPKNLSGTKNREEIIQEIVWNLC